MDDLAKRRHARQQATIRSAPPAVYRAFLEHGSRCRLYRIDQLDTDSWRAEVWFGDRIHRTAIVGVLGLGMVRKQYDREVAQLIEDGWKHVDHR